MHLLKKSMKNLEYFALSVSIISVSTAAILIVSSDAESLTIAFYRLLFTVLLILPLVFLRKKSRKELFNLERKEYLIMIGIGVILAAHFTFWITSLKYTSVASSVILVTAHPVIVGPISHYFLKERLSLINVMGITISLFGVGILVLGNYGLGAISLDSIEGNILAILGGVAAGLYILGGRKLRKTVSVTSYAFIVYSIAAIVLFILCLIFNSDLVNVSRKDYQIFILMAIISGIFGHTLYNWSLKHIRASVASVALLGEPIGSTLLAFFIPWIQQIPSNFTALGGAIILLGIYLTAKTKKSS
jgi:drug/metabolite transporter (DMT)-like permease